MVVGYCGEACRNLDLLFSDPEGVEIQADRLPDAEPILTSHRRVNRELRDSPGCWWSAPSPIAGPPSGSWEAPTSPARHRVRTWRVDSPWWAWSWPGSGFREVGDANRGALGSDRAVTIPVTLQDGIEYKVVGVCDLDCFDLDLALLDPMGVEVASDFMEDDIPFLALVPDTTAEYRIEVIMVACGVEPCSFRVATYAREEKASVAATTFSGELVFHESHEGELASGRPDRSPEPTSTLYDVDVRARPDGSLSTSVGGIRHSPEGSGSCGSWGRER